MKIFGTLFESKGWGVQAGVGHPGSPGGDDIHY